MEIGHGKHELLWQDHEVNGYWVRIVLLTNDIHAYLLEFDERYYLYLDDTSEYNGKVELLREFDSKIDATEFMHEFWAYREEVQDFKKIYESTKDRKASAKQVESTHGIATTHGEAMWFYAKRTCYFRMKGIISGKKGQATRKRNENLKRSLMSEDNISARRRRK